MSNFQSILNAVDKYAKQTGINLMENPFVDKVKGCDSPSAVLSLLQENLKAFKDYRDNNQKFIECIGPVVKFVHAFSGVLGEAARLVSRNRSFHYRITFTLSPQEPLPTGKTHLRRHRCSLHRACPHSLAASI